jgi:hypothetical protein
MNKLIRAGLVAVVAGASMFAVAPASQAAYGDMDCTAGEICNWKHGNYDTPFIDMNPTDSNWSDNVFGNGTNVNDAVSSGGTVARAVRYFQHANWTGEHFTLGVTQFDAAWLSGQPNASNPGFNFNDQVSSSHIYVPL